MSDELELDEHCLRAIGAQRCAVAVSGGSDSIALLLFMKAQAPGEILAISVDHGLRKEAIDEVEFVAKLCAEIDVPHIGLKVDVPPNGNVQANARAARYDALNEYCTKNQIDHLVIGHQMDDQIETYFLNSFRGSGVDGLSAMPAIKTGTPNILRPMLALRKADLRHYLRTQNQEWIDDPSNENMSFDRIRIRKWVEAAEGLEFENLTRTTQNMARLRDFVHEALRDAARQVLKFSPLYVEAVMDRLAFCQLHEEMQLRLLASLCRFYGGSDYKPRLNALENLRLSLQTHEGGLTLEKTEFHWEAESVKVCSEFAHLPPRAASNHWGRYHYNGHLSASEDIGAIGDSLRAFEGWREWKISARAAKGLPAIYRRDAPVSADWSAFQAQSFWNFLIYS